jgi:ferric-dicitrate binding protein FerR (iron transport regulator)
MSRTCHKARSLIDRREFGLDDVERLLLEQHIASCASCREMAAVMRSVVDTLKAAPSRLDDLSRERAIKRALGGKVEREKRRTPARLYAVALAGCAAAAVLGFFGQGLRPSAGAPLALHEPGARLPVSALRFQHEAAARVAEPASAPSPEAPWIQADQARSLHLAHALVKLERGARLRFDAETTTVRLAKGRIEVDVDARKGQRFSVLTRYFRVEVLGTRFSVSQNRVSVQRGHVQVLALDGRVLARDLTQGTSFSYSGGGDKADPSASAAELLRQARDALAQADVPAARSLIQRVERSNPARQALAEAGTLRAECALLDGSADGAVALYRQVAARFAELPAGENAAFAAAQVAVRSQGAAAARVLFQRYLDRYPNGRFAEEARKQLER